MLAECSTNLPTPITRRAFVAGTVALVAADMLGCQHSSQLSSEDLSSTTVRLPGVLVIGGGASGLCAALAAREIGAQVVVLEKTNITGGNACYVTSGINAAGTAAQQALGIDDNSEAFARDTLEGGHNQADVDLVNYLCNQASDALVWLEGFGVELDDVAQTAGMAVPRAHRPNDGMPVGSVLIPALEEAVLRQGIKVLTGTAALGFALGPDGGITAVRVTDAKLGEVLYRPDAVVLATGGLCSSTDMLYRYRPDLEGCVSTNKPASVGDGYRMAESIGAQLVNMDRIQVHPTVTLEAGLDEQPALLVPDALRSSGAILVNLAGNRFFDETAPHDYLSVALLEQAEHAAWLIFDAAIEQENPFIGTNLEPAGLVHRGETAAALASEIGLDPTALQATLDAYHAVVEQGATDMFNRVRGCRVLTGALSAVKVGVGAHYEMGGVRIDTQARVLTAEGNPILGLYAAGEVTGGVHGANRLGGNGIADAIVFGRTAGANAAQWASPASVLGRHMGRVAGSVQLSQEPQDNAVDERLDEQSARSGE